MLSSHRQSQIIVNWPLRNQSPGAKCYGNTEWERGCWCVCVCVCLHVSACACRDERSKSILNLPGLGTLTIPSPRGGLHPEARREMGPRTRA